MKAVVTHKSGKIAELLPAESATEWPAHYRGYFICFDKALFYEAHDVLEELWLGCKGEKPYFFFKGLIQLAGAFVHLQKDRLAPAQRLYQLAWDNLLPYSPSFWGLNLVQLQGIVQPYASHLGTQATNPLPLLGNPGISCCLTALSDLSA